MPEQPFFSPERASRTIRCQILTLGPHIANDRAHLQQLAFLLHSQLPSGLLIYTGTCAHWHGDCAYVSHASLYSPCLATCCCAKDVCIRLNTCQKSPSSLCLSSFPTHSVGIQLFCTLFAIRLKFFVTFPYSYLPVIPVYFSVFLPLLYLQYHSGFVVFELQPEIH